MGWFQKEIALAPRERGFHLVTTEIENGVPEIRRYAVGLAHIFIRHTSASLTINENADPTVRSDMETHFNQMVPENAPYYLHTIEGPDDMPAHIKASLLGSSVVVPVSDGRLILGTWQGVYLCEHRDRPRGRRVIVTVHGQKKGARD
jgi:secondary thiamine-phosphate synthase enzyme